MLLVLACETIIFGLSWVVKIDNPATDVYVSAQNESEDQVDTPVKFNYMKAMLISVGLAASQMTTGINSVLNFASVITAGAIPGRSRLGAVIIGTANLLGTIMALPFAQRYNRKSLLSVGYAGCIAGNVLIAVSFALDLEWLKISSFIVFLIFYQLAPGPIILALCGEAFPRSIVVKMNSLGFTVNWLVSIATIYVYPYYPAQMEYVPYIIYAVTTAMLGAMTLVLTPETLSKSCKDIDAYY